MLLKKENISTGIKEGLEVINHTGNQLTDFVTNYRKFTRIPEPNKTIFELGDFLNIIIRAMKATTDLPVRFKVNIEPSDLISLLPSYIYSSNLLLATNLYPQKLVVSKTR